MADDKKDDPNLEAVYGDIIDTFEAVDPDLDDPHDTKDPHENQDPHEEEA